MINEKDNFVAWVALIQGLDDAKEHLAELSNELHSAGRMDEAELAVHLGHVYAHLNRVWNSRNSTVELTDEEWKAFSQFPKDLAPVG